MCLPRDGTEDADLDRVAADRDRVAGRALETTHCPFEVAYCGRQTVHILVEEQSRPDELFDGHCVLQAAAETQQRAAAVGGPSKHEDGRAHVQVA